MDKKGTKLERMARLPRRQSVLSFSSDSSIQEPPPSYAQAVNVIAKDGRINFDPSRLLAQLPQDYLLGLPRQPPPFQHEDVVVEGPDSKIPKLNIVMQVVGSRGDVQPFIAIGQKLKTYGHRVRIATHPIFRSFVIGNGLEFFSIGGDPSELMAFMVKNPGLIPRFRAVQGGEVRHQRKMVREMLRGCWRSCIQSGDGMPRDETESSANGGESCDRDRNQPFVADAIIANPPAFAHIYCAEKLRVPLHIVFTMPWTPTSAFGHPLANIHSGSPSDKHTSNYLSYYFVLDLEPLNSMRAPGIVHTLGIPHTYTWSPSLIAKPEDWPKEVGVTGFAFLQSTNNFDPPERILQFLDAGPPPVYIGFGSIVFDDPERLTNIVMEVVQRLRIRAIIAMGWAQLGQDRRDFPESVLMVNDCPHDWLFPRVACVVHHGGAGTTAAGLAAGCPTVIIPFFGDQLFWGREIHRAGAGPAPIPWKSLSVTGLEEAILSALNAEVKSRAESIADLIAQEDGLTNAVDNFHSNFPHLGSHCALQKNRLAVWRIRRRKAQLSALAATILIQEGKVKVKDLELYRPNSYDLSQGPVEPFTGAIYSVLDLFYDTFKGCGEIVTDIVTIPQQTARLALQSKASKDTAQACKEAERAARDAPQFTKDEAQTTEIKNSSHQQLANPSTENVAKDSPTRPPGKLFANGCLRIVKSAARAPGEFTLAMAKGAHNAPRLWGDQTVRPQAKVTGVGSGLYAGVSELFLDTYDGITGLIMQPVNDVRAHGPIGLATGIAKGTLGLPIKFLSGASAVVGYPLKGVDRSITKMIHRDNYKAIKLARLEQGIREASSISTEQRVLILRSWEEKFAKH